MLTIKKYEISNINSKLQTPNPKPETLLMKCTGKQIQNSNIKIKKDEETNFASQNSSFVLFVSFASLVYLYVYCKLVPFNFHFTNLTNF